MANGAYVQARMDPSIKEQAQAVLKKLGISMSDAIVFYFNQIVMRQGIPFDLKIPNELTAKTLEKAEKGEDVHEFADVNSLLKELHN